MKFTYTNISTNNKKLSATRHSISVLACTPCLPFPMPATPATIVKAAATKVPTII